MKKYVILHPTGRISRLVIKHLLADPQFSDVELELLTQRPELLADLAKGDRIKLTEGAATDLDKILVVTKDADLVFLGKVDDKKFTVISKNLVKASQENGFDRVIELSLAGLYYEIPGDSAPGSMNGWVPADFCQPERLPTAWKKLTWTTP